MGNNSGSQILAVIMVRSMSTTIFSSIGSLLLKHEAPRNANNFLTCPFFCPARSSTNSRLILAFSKVMTLDWKRMKSVVSVLQAIVLRTRRTQIELRSELYYIWYSVYGSFYFYFYFYLGCWVTGVYICIYWDWDWD